MFPMVHIHDGNKAMANQRIVRALLLLIERLLQWRSIEVEVMFAEVELMLKVGCRGRGRQSLRCLLFLRVRCGKLLMKMR